MREGHAGSGPGPITPDGCAVELWERLPVLDEPDIIASAVPPGATILELGCGAGRVTRPLMERGFTVTGVDESAAMLARMPYVRTVHAQIETLQLKDRFDVVLLSSYLVNTGDATLRQELLETCRRHLAPGGCVLVQREGEGWHEGLPKEGRRGDVVVRQVRSEPVGDGVHSVHTEYLFPDVTFTQTFLSRPLGRQEFEKALAEAGLVVDEYLDDEGIWVRVVAA